MRKCANEESIINFAENQACAGVMPYPVHIQLLRLLFNKSAGQHCGSWEKLILIVLLLPLPRNNS
jgi:hypothetical protein